MAEAPTLAHVHGAAIGPAMSQRCGHLLEHRRFDAADDPGDPAHGAQRSRRPACDRGVLSSWALFTGAAVVLGLVLTLVLPIYPDGVDLPIAVFLALTVAGAAGGLMHRAARRELLVLSPWAGVLLLAMVVGSVRRGEWQQATEDMLPYILFALGLFAGRGLRNPRGMLAIVLWICVADSLVSLWKMPALELSSRSTYTYWKITAGLPLVGMFTSSLLRHTDPRGRPPGLSHRPIEALVYGVMLIALLFTVSRGMMLGWVFGLFVMIYIRRPSQMLAVGLVLGVGAIVYSSTFADIGTRYLRADQASTIEDRFREVEIAWESFVNNPLLGAGLGATAEVDGTYKSYVHNMAAYHLWKFGLVGSLLVAIPILVVGRQVLAAARPQRAAVLGGAAAIVAYLLTCAAYKTYYLVWIYGIVAGATLSWLTAWRARMAARDADLRAEIDRASGALEGARQPAGPRRDPP